MRDMNQIVGSHNILLVTIDTLRYDVAQQELEAGRLPVLSAYLGDQWERRHSPGSFTYAAHQAFFAGFLPTPITEPHQARLFALRFPGSESIGETTCVFDASDIVKGLRQVGYYSLCVGGVGFFNGMTALSRVFPDLFDEHVWEPRMGVADSSSTQHQVSWLVKRLSEMRKQRVFAFLNISAIHQPNNHYLPESNIDSLASHAAALRYVDHQLQPLFEACEQSGPWFVILCSDHGTCYGEDGYTGHRIAHQHVWEVPYADFVLPLMDAST
jgi:membrane-anchored protein YejM (alkaline phosphatase superfamily)